MALVLALGLASAGPPPPTAPVGAPELVVTLTPATGLIPLDTEDRLAPYTFSVFAWYREERKGLASAQVFVRPGQRRRVDETTDLARVRGIVELAEDGVANYSAELIQNGRAVARTRATLTLALPK